MKSYTKGWDIWQAGCVLFELATQRRRFNNVREILEFVNGQETSFDEQFLLAAYPFPSSRLVSRYQSGAPDRKVGMGSLLNPMVEKRPGAGDVKEMFHDFLIYGTVGTPFLAKPPDTPPL